MNKIKIFLPLLLLLLTSQSTKGSDITWQQAKKSRKALITIHYKPNEPFLISNDSLWLEGLEYDMMIGFQHYLLHHYNLNLQYEWVESKNLLQIFDRIQQINKPGEIGLDIISWTADRELNVKFSKPYFPDFQVLVTHRSNPTVLHQNDFGEFYSYHEAITVAGTTYEANLKNISRFSNLNLNLKYIENSTEIIETIINNPNSFGYSDLTRYLLALEKNLPVKRLNAFAVKGHGLGVIFNKNSDWEIPFNEYLASPEFEKLRSRGLLKYFGPDFNAFVENLEGHQDEEIVLLMQEKKFMDEEIETQLLIAQKQSKIKDVLIVGVSITLLISFFLFNRYHIKSKANKNLREQREIIENQNKLLAENVIKLTEVNEDKNSYIRILSHDLRAPINNINGISQLLLDTPEQLDKEQSSLLHHIADESKRLSDMVTRILDVEKIESQKIEEFESINLYDILSKVIINFSNSAKNKGISLEQKLDSNTFVLGLEPFLFHVFDNLLSNAIKFSPHGSTIQIQSVVINEEIQVRIKDQGPGITEEDQKKMFKKFQMLSAKATADEKSSGLGLSIVHKYIKLLNAQLTWETEVGIGTTFIVQFPHEELAAS